MTEPDGKLESWKQIASYLDRSERTVRRWEEIEGLPVHRHNHSKGGTVVAYPEELDRWREARTKAPISESLSQPKGRRWLLGSSLAAVTAGVGAIAWKSDAFQGTQHAAASSPSDVLDAGYLAEYQEITKVMEHYLACARAGNSDLMRPAVCPGATIAGYCFGKEYLGSVEALFEWFDENGPSPNIVPWFAGIEILGSIAVVNLEVSGWSGLLVKGGVHRTSDVFTLLKRNGRWQITQKTWHWHSD